MSGRSNEKNQRNLHMSTASLLLEYRHFIDSHASLSELNQQHNCWSSIAAYCQELEGKRELLEALTTLHARSQIDFERALFCSWMCLLIASDMQLDAMHRRALFFAGLFQDLGKYALEGNVQEMISRVNAPFVSNVHRFHQDDAHPLVGSTFLETQLPDVEGLGDLVLHHHARDDGCGYPQHVGESQLNLDNQLLIIANELSDRLDRKGGHNALCDCVPSLKLGAFLYFKRAHQAWLDVLIPICDVAPDIQDDERFMHVLEQKREVLSKLLACLLSVSAKLLPYDFDLSIHGLRSIIQKFARLFAETGVLHRDVFRVSDSVSAEVLHDSASLFQALPELLYRAETHVSTLMSKRKYELNAALLADAKTLLNAAIRELDPHRPGIFR